MLTGFGRVDIFKAVHSGLVNVVREAPIHLDDKAFHNDNGLIGSNGLLTRVKSRHDLVSRELVGDVNIVNT